MANCLIAKTRELFYAINVLRPLIWGEPLIKMKGGQ